MAKLNKTTLFRMILEVMSTFVTPSTRLFTENCFAFRKIQKNPHTSVYRSNILYSIFRQFSQITVQTFSSDDVFVRVNRMCTNVKKIKFLTSHCFKCELELWPSIGVVRPIILRDGGVSRDSLIGIMNFY